MNSEPVPERVWVNSYIEKCPLCGTDVSHDAMSVSDCFRCMNQRCGWSAVYARANPSPVADASELSNIAFLQKVAAIGCRRIDADEENVCGFYERDTKNFCAPCEAECLLEHPLVPTAVPTAQGMEVIKNYRDEILEENQQRLSLLKRTGLMGCKVACDELLERLQSLPPATSGESTTCGCVKKIREIARFNVEYAKQCEQNGQQKAAAARYKEAAALFNVCDQLESSVPAASSNLEPHEYQEHPHYPDYCGFAVGQEDYCKRGAAHAIHRAASEVNEDAE